MKPQETSSVKAGWRTLRLVMLTLAISSSVFGQMRNYGIVYSDNIRGDVTTFGNTLMALGFWNTSTINTGACYDNAATGNSTFTNNFQNMLYVDVDGSTGDGGATRNSSTATLELPAGVNDIKMARLYWGGRARKDNFDMDLASNRTIRIRKGTSGSYSEFAAQLVDRQVDSVGTVEEFSLYQAYTDITGFIKSNGAGEYTVGNAALSTGVGGNAGNYGGWAIVVVYENSTLPYSSIRVYDGFQEVWSYGNPISSTVTITGLDAPSGILNLTDAKMTHVTWEGDANFNLDFLKINDSLFQNELNPADNPMNGTITRFGQHVTNRNPDYTNSFGIDIDEFFVGTGYGIQPNDNSVRLQFGTELDQFFPGLFTFVMRMKDPTVSLEKSVTDASGNQLVEAGEILTYTLKGKNTGLANANQVVLTDTLPSTVTYIPGSLFVVTSPGISAGSQTDASGDDVAEYIQNGQTSTVLFRLGTGANAFTGGTLSANDSFEVRFQVVANPPAANEQLTPVINIARLSALSDANETFVDDGIAIILPELRDLPVVLAGFNAALENNFRTVHLNWSTAMELNSSRFEIERSADGRNFQKVGTVLANGQTDAITHYSFNDPINPNQATILYYRLRMVDLDNKQAYSKVAAVRLPKGGTQVLVAPNPFNNYLQVILDNPKSEPAQIHLLDQQGRFIINKSQTLQKGTNLISLEGLNVLPAGTYLLQIKTTSGSVFQRVLHQ